MKTKQILGLLLIIFISTVSSCMQSTKTTGNRNDSIKLSTHRANLSASNDSIVITTKGTLWSVNDIIVNGNYLVFNPIETEKDNFAIKGNWFSIERNNKQKLIVRVAANKLATQRNIKITLGARDYFDYIDVNQMGRN